jgi:WD40 repeat protein
MKLKIAAVSTLLVTSACGLPFATPQMTATRAPSPTYPSVPAETSTAPEAAPTAAATAFPTRGPTATLIPTATLPAPANNTLPVPEGAAERLGIGGIRSIELSPDGGKLAVVSSLGVLVYEASTFRLLWGAVQKQTPTFAAFSPNGEMLATTSPAGEIVLWSTGTGEQIYTFAIEDNYAAGGVRAVWSPDGTMLATKGYSRTTYVWNIQTGTLFRRLEGVAEFSVVLAWSPDSVILVSVEGGYERKSGVAAWNIVSGQAIALEEPKVTYQVDFDGQQPIFRTAPIWGATAWSPDRSTYAQMTPTGTPVELYDATNDQVIMTLEGDGYRYGYALEFSPDGSQIVLGERDEIIVWDSSTGSIQQRLATTATDKLIWSPDGTMLYAYGDIYAGSGYDPSEYVVAAIDVANNRIANVLRGSNPITQVAWTEDGHALNTYASYTLVTWDLDSKESTPPLLDRPFPPRLSADGELELRWNGQMLEVWHSPEHALLRSFAAHSLAINDAAWHPSERMIATGSDDQTVRLWNPDTGEQIATLEGLIGKVRAVAWSPDGNSLAAAQANEIVIWDWRAGTKLLNLRAHTGFVTDVEWSHDGQHLASSGEDGRIIVWNANTWEIAAEFEGHNGAVRAVAWSPDDRRIASGADDGTVLLWPVE